jgi:hypothetical protein
LSSDSDSDSDKKKKKEKGKKGKFAPKGKAAAPPASYWAGLGRKPKGCGEIAGTRNKFQGNPTFITLIASFTFFVLGHVRKKKK